MRLLLDTHVLLWALSDSRRMPRDARHLMTGADQVFVSAASIWEIAIKRSLGKLDFDAAVVLDELEACGFFSLNVTPTHAAAVQSLPGHHGDPFDRLLIAQAQMEPLILLTHDPLLAPYGDFIRLV